MASSNQATPKQLIFGLRLSQVPLINARSEFNANRQILNSPEFRAQIANRNRSPIHARYILWGAEPSLLLNLFLQRAIIGLEAYIPGAVFLASAHYGRLTLAVKRVIDDPFCARKSTVASTFYNHLPGLIDPSFRMAFARAGTWKNVSRFYNEIRNPLFHGHQLCTPSHNQEQTLDSVLQACDLFAEAYDWVDMWCPLEFLNATGTVAVSKIPTIDPRAYGIKQEN